MRPGLILTILLFSSAANAAVLSLDATQEKLEEVPLANKGIVTVETAIPVTRLGYGLRKKKVAIVSVKVYVGQLFGSDANAYKRAEADALSSLSGMKAAAIQLNFLRDVDAESLSNSFDEAFVENGIEKNPALTKFLETAKATGEVKEGGVIRIAGERLANGKEAIAYETPGGNVTKIGGEAGLIRSVFSIWLGKMDDSGLEDLRDALIKGKWEP